MSRSQADFCAKVAKLALNRFVPQHVIDANSAVQRDVGALREDLFDSNNDVGVIPFDGIDEIVGGPKRLKLWPLVLVFFHKSILGKKAVEWMTDDREGVAAMEGFWAVPCNERGSRLVLALDAKRMLRVALHKRS